MTKEQITNTHHAQPYIVAIGASAGGLAPIEQFFTSLPKTPLNAIFVLIQHLPPDYKSLMPELLARHTDIPIHAAEDNMQAKPGHIYLAPAHQEMILYNDRFVLKEREQPKTFLLPIDIFLSSLAQTAGKRAIAIILSGTGADGARGIVHIHRNGGQVLVQDPDDASFDGMPTQTLATNMVDHMGTPKYLADLVVATIADKPIEKHEVVAPKETPPEPDFELEDAINSDEQKLYRQLLFLLQQAYGIHFQDYRQATLYRRLIRRMAFQQCESLQDYLDLIKREPRELELMYHDMLIGVTDFFRDTSVFNHFADVILPSLVKPLEKHEEFRVWVAGCATGEEAYSMAMLLEEYIEKTGEALNYKILATDIHYQSLEFASQGIYPQERLKNITAERRQDFFRITDVNHFQVNPDLRKKILFSRHDLTQDPPFTRIHLILCRNVLIYLQPEIQQRVIGLFHFALQKQGMLWLGPSESLGNMSDEFITINSQWRFYQKSGKHLVNAAIEKFRMHPLYQTSILNRVTSKFIPTATEHVPSSAHKMYRLYDAILDHYVQLGLLLDSQEKLLQSFGDTTLMLLPLHGRINLAINDLLRPELKTSIFSLLTRARHQKKSARLNNYQIHIQERNENVNYHLIVDPIFDPKDASLLGYLIKFEAVVESKKQLKQKQSIIHHSTNESEDIAILQQELRQTQEHLQNTIEALQMANEELQLTNEELQSTVEELQSTNEELQASNEELQAVNEELHTVNHEYQRKVDEVSSINDDLVNTFNCIDVGVVFLDKELRIRRFTNSATLIFNLRETDIGRSFANIDHKLDHDSLLKELSATLLSGQPLIHEVQSYNHWFSLRIFPYITAQKTIEGVILSLVDIHALKEAELNTKRNEKQLRFIMENINDGYWDWQLNPDGSPKNEEYLSPSLKQMFGYDDHEMENTVTALNDIVFQEDADLTVKNRQKHIETDGKHPYYQVVRYRHKDGHTVWVICRGVALKNAQGEYTHMVGNHIDITPLKTAELALEGQHHLLQSVISTLNDGIFVTDTDNRILFENDHADIYYQAMRPDRALLESEKAQWRCYIPDDQDPLAPKFLPLVRALQGETLNQELLCLRKNNDLKYIEVNAKPVLDLASNTIEHVVTFCRDVTEQVSHAKAIEDAHGITLETKTALEKSNKALEQFAYMVSHDLQGPLRHISTYVDILCEELSPEQLSNDRRIIVEQIKSSAIRMRDMVNSILDVATMRNTAPKFEQVNLRELVDRAITSLDQDAEAFTINLSLADNNASLTVYCDADKIVLVLHNLLQNALKYREPERPLLIDIIVTGVDDNIQFCVADNGSGIKAEHLEKIFQMFCRQHGAKVPGLGIGLALCQAIVELHSGKIWAESQLDQGSQFYFTLPQPHKY